MQPAKTFYIGTSGIVVPVLQSHYPAAFRGKSRLSFYASMLNSLEVNSTFYKDPKSTTIQRWIAEVDGDFRFTFKISKAISHAKALEFNPEDVNRFTGLIDHAEQKRGCILVQLPPSLSVKAMPQLYKLLVQLRTNDPGNTWKIAVEFRHPSWYVKEVNILLQEFHACMVIHDLPKSATPINEQGEFFYVRFHGENGRYRGNYDEVMLQPYVSLVKEWLNAGKTGYWYFNNTMGEAFANAEKLKRMVNA